MKTLPLTDARGKLGNLVRRVSARDDEIVITRNGRPAAVLVGAAKFEGWKETVAIRENNSLIKEIRAGLRALNAGRAKLYAPDDL